MTLESLEGWTPNEVVHLKMISEKKESTIAQWCNTDRMIKKGLLSSSRDITDEGLAFLSRVFGSKKIADDSDIEELSIKFRELFPSGVNSGGYAVKSNLTDIKAKLRQFKNKYRYSDEEILNATQEYVNLMKRQGYNYMTMANYFILKDGQSKLASVIEDMKSKPTTPKDEWGITV
jgi:DNA-binding MltR family transcriptional regulator